LAFSQYQHLAPVNGSFSVNCTLQYMQSVSMIAIFNTAPPKASIIIVVYCMNPHMKAPNCGIFSALSYFPLVLETLLCIQYNKPVNWVGQTSIRFNLREARTGTLCLLSAVLQFIIP